MFFFFGGVSLPLYIFWNWNFWLNICLLKLHQLLCHNPRLISFSVKLILHFLLIFHLHAKMSSYFTKYKTWWSAMFSFLRAAILVLDEGSLPELFAKNCFDTAMSNMQKKMQTKCHHPGLCISHSGWSQGSVMYPCASSRAVKDMAK